MDRRAFLKSLAALGVAIAAAALVDRASRRTVDAAVAALDGTPWWVPVIAAWRDAVGSPALEDLCDALDVPSDVECSRSDVAVARLLLGAIQEDLPAWTTVNDTGFVTARPEFPKRLDGTPVFEPAFVGTINWADSGPGFAWPEAYHVTRVPELGIHVVTASRDSEDTTMGCTDHAIGWRPATADETQAARELIVADWRARLAEYDQSEWACVLDGGLLDEDELEAMRELVWNDDVEEGDAEEAAA